MAARNPLAGFLRAQQAAARSKQQAQQALEEAQINQVRAKQAAARADAESKAIEKAAIDVVKAQAAGQQGEGKPEKLFKMDAESPQAGNPANALSRGANRGLDQVLAQASPSQQASGGALVQSLGGVPDTITSTQQTTREQFVPNFGILGQGATVPLRSQTSQTTPNVLTPFQAGRLQQEQRGLEQTDAAADALARFRAEKLRLEEVRTSAQAQADRARAAASDRAQLDKDLTAAAKGVGGLMIEVNRGTITKEQFQQELEAISSIFPPSELNRLLARGRAEFGVLLNEEISKNAISRDTEFFRALEEAQAINNKIAQGEPLTEQETFRAPILGQFLDTRAKGTGTRFRFTPDGGFTFEQGPGVQGTSDVELQQTLFSAQNASAKIGEILQLAEENPNVLAAAGTVARGTTAVVGAFRSLDQAFGGKLTELTSGVRESAEIAISTGRVPSEEAEEYRKLFDPVRVGELKALENSLANEMAASRGFRMTVAAVERIAQREVNLTGLAGNEEIVARLKKLQEDFEVRARATESIIRGTGGSPIPFSFGGSPGRVVSTPDTPSVTPPEGTPEFTFDPATGEMIKVK
jgi:hypothetical protein